MVTIAFVTSRDWQELTPDDRLAANYLRQHGTEVSPVRWDDDDVNWGSFDVIVLRSVWDYHLRLIEFRDWLARIDDMECSLSNPSSLVRWNLDKKYLAQLQNQGVPIPRTLFLSKGETAHLSALFDRLDCKELVVKPTVSASAYRLARVSRQNASDDQVRLDEMLKEHDVMAQPFMTELAEHGEWSLVFFNKEFSHAVVKRAGDGDFRVQAELGGRTERRETSSILLEQANRVMQQVDGHPLYARVDLVEVEGRALLMELELIEPELFFASDPESLERFRKALRSVLPGMLF